MPALHSYTPVLEVCHAINDRFLGRYSITELPLYYQPTPQGLIFADRLIDRVVHNGDTELVIGDSIDCHTPEYANYDEPWRPAFENGLLGVVGPQGLAAELGGNDIINPDAMLWDRGLEERVLVLSGISKDIKGI